MKKISLFIFLYLLAVSCNDIVQLPDSIYKADIQKYFGALKSADPSILLAIEEIQAKIDIQRIATISLRTKEELVIADLKGKIQGLGDADIVKVIFYWNKGQIVRSNILAFSNKLANPNYEKVIGSVLNANGKGIDYSGKISFYSIVDRRILFLDEFENGYLRANGITRPSTQLGKKGNAGGRTNECIDWYLVTTYHLGSYSYTVSDYIGTTCRPKGCEVEITRIGRVVDCGGGGGGGGGGAAGGFPSNPQNGDEYFETDQSGKFTHYIFNAAKSIWQIVSVVLPPVYVYGNSLPGFLAAISNPYNNQVVIGDDGLIYHYEEAGGNWVGELAEFTVDQTVGRLCDRLTCSHVGRSFTAEVTGLGLTATNHMTNTAINAELGTTCVEIPDYNLRDRYEASSAFVRLFNQARDRIPSMLNAGILAPNSVAIRDKLKSLVLEYLNAEFPGAAFSTSSCAGGVAKNVADYGC